MEVFEYVIHDEGWESSSVISLNEGSKIPQNAVEVISLHCGVSFTNI